MKSPTGNPYSAHRKMAIVSKIPCPAMNNILTAIQIDYEALGNKKSFRAVGDIWGLSSGTTHRMITKGHWPASKRIRRVLMEKARERGIQIISRKRMRIEIDPEISKDKLKAIREMTTEQRTEVLIDFIKGEE